MHLERNLNPPLRAIYIVLGVLLVAYGAYGHEVMPGIEVAVLIVVGVLLVLAGAGGT